MSLAFGIPFVVWSPSQRKVPFRYGVAIATVLIATVLSLVFLQAFETRFPFLTFYPAVVLASMAACAPVL
jgi:hypothetical protein